MKPYVTVAFLRSEKFSLELKISIDSKNIEIVCWKLIHASWYFRKLL